MVVSTSEVTKSSAFKTSLSSGKSQTAVVSDLIRIIEQEYKRGNRTVTHEKYAAILKLRDFQAQEDKGKSRDLPALPAPLYPSIFGKFKLPAGTRPRDKPLTGGQRSKSWTFKQIETTLIAVLEAFANILDNLHLLSKMPVFPKSLSHLLKHTNRIWVLILVFLVRKTLSQLINLRRKERKVISELAILRGNANSKLLEQNSSHDENSIFHRYEKVLKDLKFDKTMLRIELLGNLLDLAFNIIELYALAVPGWFMSVLNLASMAMTVYRMNKDDEHVDDDISQELI
ncbi:hypothetical protein OXX59_006841 [Metschnikowia pulcherrima]